MLFASFFSIGLLAAIPIASGMHWGEALTQKGLTDYAMPVGAFWCALWIGTWWSWGMRLPWRVTGLWLVTWLIWGAVGNRVLASRLSDWYEQEYAQCEPEGHYDAVIVLGGGVVVDHKGRIAISEDGQRAIFAARMFHRKETDRLIATGSRIEGYSQDSVDPKEATSRLVQELGVPADAVVPLDGINTSEEMKSVRVYLEDPERKSWRVALVTSSFHMPRAMRLAKAEGLNIEPLPTAFRVSHQATITPIDFIPTVAAVDRNGRNGRLLRSHCQIRRCTATFC